MKKIVADVYMLLFKITKSNIVSVILAILITAGFSYILLQGLVSLFEGLLPTKPLNILFTSKLKWFTLIGLVIITFLANIRVEKLVEKQNRKPDYIMLSVLTLITILLIAYLKVIAIME